MVNSRCSAPSQSSSNDQRNERYDESTLYNTCAVCLLIKINDPVHATKQFAQSDRIRLLKLWNPPFVHFVCADALIRREAPSASVD